MGNRLTVMANPPCIYIYIFETFGLIESFSSQTLSPPLLPHSLPSQTCANSLSSAFIPARPLILIEKLLLEIVGLLHTAY